MYEQAGFKKGEQKRGNSRSCSSDSFKSGVIYSEQNSVDELDRRRDRFMKRLEKKVIRNQGIHGYETETQQASANNAKARAKVLTKLVLGQILDQNEKQVKEMLEMQD